MFTHERSVDENFLGCGVITVLLTFHEQAQKGDFMGRGLLGIWTFQCSCIQQINVLTFLASIFNFPCSIICGRIRFWNNLYRAFSSTLVASVAVADATASWQTPASWSEVGVWLTSQTCWGKIRWIYKHMRSTLAPRRHSQAASVQCAMAAGFLPCPLRWRQPHQQLHRPQTCPASLPAHEFPTSKSETPCMIQAQDATSWGPSIGLRPSRRVLLQPASCEARIQSLPAALQRDFAGD